MTTTSQRFISEPLQPVIKTMDTTPMTAGEPGLPREFLWRGKTVVITEIVRRWRETKRCHHGSPETYLRKHWYEVRTSDNRTMKIYFDRQPEGGDKNMGWWLFSASGRDPGKKIRPRK